MREHWLAAYVCAVGACFSPAPPAGIPCGPDFTCPGDQTCDIISNTCGEASEALAWRDDTAADFGAAGAYLDEVTLEKQGFVGPVAYLSGGVRVTAYDGLLVPDANAQFETIAASTPTGTGVQRDLRIDYSDFNPPGLNLASGDNATITVEGEIELDVAGNFRFRLTANDRGFFEIETAPGSGTFLRLIDDDDVTTIGTFSAPTAGWYRYRGAFQDAAQFFDYTLQYDPPNVNGNAFLDIPVDRLRVRAGDLEGLIVDGFESGFMMEHVATVLSGAPLTNVTLNNPLGLPVGVGDLSVRWNGQFLVDTAGDYTFRLVTTEGHRMWVDGVSLVDKFAEDPETTVTAAVTLDAGWHDLVIDVSKAGGPNTGTAAITIESAPDQTLVGGWFPADHLRPISGRGARFLSEHNASALAIPDGTTAANRQFTSDVPPGVTVDWVFASVSIDHALPSSVQIVIDPPNAGPMTVAAFGTMNDGDPEHSFFLPMPIATGVGGNWQFLATDNLADTLTGTITRAAVTVVYSGGPAPFPTTYRYQSAVRDLGDVVAFERFAWVLRQAPDPAAVVVRLRTCDSAEACEAETYVDVVNGEAPGVPVRRFAQYEVVFTGNGELPTALDAVELRYFVRGQ